MTLEIARRPSFHTASVVYCRPRTSALRSHNLGVIFPAVSSRTRPALADPQLTFRILGSCRTAKPQLYAFRIHEAAARGHREPLCIAARKGAGNQQSSTAQASQE